MTCPICEKNQQVNPKEIYRNKNIVISHAPLHANLLGYFYVEPTNHYENWAEIPLEVLSDVQAAIKKADSFLRTEKLAERVYSVTISEAVRHIHFHLIPRKEDAKLKGIPLIEKATQQLAHDDDPVITEQAAEEFIQKAKKFFTE